MILLLMNLALNAQITVSRDGHVGIGSRHTTYGLDVRVNSGILFSSSGGEGITFRLDSISCEEDFVFSQYSNEPMLRTNSSYFGYLGNGSNKLNEIHAHRIFSDFHFVPADQERMQNIMPINGALSRILSVQGVGYDLHKDNFKHVSNEAKKASLMLGSRNHFGVIAQELKSCLPELVRTNKDGSLSINYDGFIPLLIEALKEQQKTIGQLEDQLNYLKTYLQINLPDESSSDSPILFQNTPNPFSNETEIISYVPGSATEATLSLCDLNGIQLRSYNLGKNGFSSIRLYSSELLPGIYLYTLFVDGKKIGTRKMVLSNQNN
jgi:hypothetical protein